MDPVAEEDLSNGYMVVAQARTTEATVDDFMRRMESKQEPVEPAPQPAAPVGSSANRIRVTPRRETGAAAAVGAVAADIGQGFIEAPAAVIGGVNDAVRNTATGARNLADWFDALTGTIPFPNTGIAGLDKAIQRPLDAIVDLLPEATPEEKSTTGHIVREASRFLTGFVPAARVFGASTIAGATASGAASDFITKGPGDKMLADFLKEVPALQGPVVDFLASNPDDPEAVKRLKHAAEGAGLGVLAEGVVRGVKVLAQSRRARSELNVQQQQASEIVAQETQQLGDPAGPLVTVGDPKAKLAAASKTTETGVPIDVAARGTMVKETAANPVYVNFARMQTSDDVNTVIGNMANAFKSEIDEARRGVQTNQQTKKLAEDLGMTAEDLLTRRRGDPLNAEETLAARRLWATSAEKLTDAARRAAAPNAGPVDLYTFRRMLAVHQAIQSEVIAARTETARALQSWSIPAGAGGAERVRSIETLLDSAGGSPVTAELAKRIASLADQGVPAGAIAEATRRGWAATTMDGVKEAYVLGLLWNPTTHVVNAASNTIVAFQSVYERGVASRIGDFLGSSVDARVVDGEALAMAYGMLSSLKDAFRLGSRALRTGQAGASIGQIDLPHQQAISSGVISRELGHSVVQAQEFAETGMGRAIDFVGTATRLPGHALAGSDEFFKTITFRAEVHAQALRQATQEGATGPELFRRMAEIANNPPENIRMAAADAALLNTFQNRPGEWAQSLMQMRNSGSLNPTFLVLPFVRTPANILRHSFEHTPLAPFVGQWRADIAAGGARRDLALARMATGTAIIATAMDLASSGLITGPGPSDPGKKEALIRQGWQPNSAYINGKYYSFNRADPLGMLLGFAGAVSERMKASDSAPEDFDQWEEILAAGIGAVSASVVDKSYFKGVSDILTAIQGSEKGEGGLVRYVDRQSGSMLPMSSALGAMKRFADPTTREINSPWDAIEARIIGLSTNLPPARDLWGAERKPAEVYGRVYDALSPVAVRERVASPIDAEIERLGASVRRIQKKGNFQGAEVNFREFPEVYDEYVRLAGNELKHPAYGMGAKDFLDAVVSGRSDLSAVYREVYTSDGPDGARAAFIKNTISEYRQLAQERIMAQPERFPIFVDYVNRRKQQKQDAKMPGAQ